MSTEDKPNNEIESRWQGLRSTTRKILETRDYSKGSVAERLSSSGVAVSEAIASQDELSDVWIPGVELTSRRIFHQRGRGYFGEFTRLSEGVPHKIGLAPRQWANALMHFNTAKGFHIHPPYIPDGYKAEEWFQKLYIDEAENFSLRPYDKEQWDMMFFITSICEMILIDERVGMPRRVMRFIIQGDSLPGTENASVIIPAGVAHALRNIGKDDLIMVYGTSTVFNPDWEGRIESGVETSDLPPDWLRYIEN